MSAAGAGAGTARAPGVSGDEASNTERLARAVFAVLVLACLAAFLITQHLKHAPTAVQEPKLTPSFSPFPGGSPRAEAISFKLAKADSITVTVENSRGTTVATLVRDRPLARYKVVSLRWNGRVGNPHHVTSMAGTHDRTVLRPHNSGAYAPAGEYSVLIHLSDQDRYVHIGRSFKLVAR